MNPETWKRIQDVFAAALERPPAERDAFVARECADDEAVRSEVAALIAAHGDAERDGFIETPAARLDGERGLEGEHAGPWRIVGEVGRGGMGTVYRAVRADDAFSKLVALKVVRRGMDSEFVLQRFLSERRILAALDHPGIARLLDAGTVADGRPYLVMEFVDGAPITEYAERENLGVRERVALFVRVCEAVHHAHRNLVVHRDLKPSNILVGADGQPKLLDFGIAKLLEPGAEDAATVTGVRLMTPEYASPEQVLGRPVTTSTDVYALGVLLYELLAGRRPYELDTRTPEAAFRAVVRTVPGPPSEAAITKSPRWRRQLQGDLDTIVLVALRKEPERRYGSVEQLGEDLRRFLDSRPVSARPDTFAYRLARFTRRNRLAVAAGAVAALALVGGAGVALHQGGEARAERALAQKRLDGLRKLATSFLFDFHDSIEGLAGATAAREKVVTTALVYLDQLAREASEEPALRREVAAAYQRLASIQGMRLSANLGDTAAGVASQRKAVSIYEQLVAERPTPEARADLATAYAELSNLFWGAGDTGGALDYDRKSLALWEVLASEKPGDADVEREMGTAESRLADRLAWTGDVHASLDMHRRAVALFDAVVAGGAGDLKTRRQQAVAYLKLGNILGNPNFPNAGNVEGARQWIGKGVAVLEDLARAYPTDVRVRRTLAVVHSNLSDVEDAAGDLASAIASWRRSGALFGEIAAADPADAQAAQDLAIGHSKGGDLLVKAKRFDEAEAEFRAATAILEPLVAKDPADAQARENLGVNYSKLGTEAARRGRFAEALAYYDKTLRIVRDLAEADPMNTEKRLAVAQSLAGLADVRAEMARRAPQAAVRRESAARARDVYAESLAIMREIDGKGALSPSDRPMMERVAKAAGEPAR